MRPCPTLTLNQGSNSPVKSLESDGRSKCTHVTDFDIVSRRDPENREKRQKLFKNIIRNALYELPNQKSSFRTNQIPSYNVNVDVNETENSQYARESMPSRLVPSRTQRVGTKRGQPAEKPIENNDAKRVSYLARNPVLET